MPSQIGFDSIRSNWASIYGASNHNVDLGSMRGVVVYDSSGYQYTTPSTNLGIGYFIGSYSTDPTGGLGVGSGQSAGTGDFGGPGGFA